MYRLAMPICYPHLSYSVFIPTTNSSSSSSSTLLFAKSISFSGRRRTTANEFQLRRRCSKDSDASLSVEEEEKQSESDMSFSPLDKDLKKVVQKTASTFAPRASTASKNPAVPGSTLYKVFEVQAYASMVIGGALSFNLIFPSTEPDLWRLMGMWSIWMFTIPSLRARDCSKKEKEALNYLFLLVPLLNVLIPFFIKSFAVVWSADSVAFLAMYVWKLGLLQKKEEQV
ncbi:hypothetical protein ZOSMA_8G00390 [Zostera marina]|uniref:Resistance to phytophthora 1 n=1 Tax=Zostera marina TaxID=29655 RepID=A0A0K9NLN3_ZOSMR|nr:hypothetical protein ZOSMA_8G00390 [Zostera marina]